MTFAPFHQLVVLRSVVTRLSLQDNRPLKARRNMSTRADVQSGKCDPAATHSFDSSLDIPLPRFSTQFPIRCTDASGNMEKVHLRHIPRQVTVGLLAGRQDRQ